MQFYMLKLVDTGVHLPVCQVQPQEGESSENREKAPRQEFHALSSSVPNPQRVRKFPLVQLGAVCTENLVRVDAVMESPKLAE